MRQSPWLAPVLLALPGLLGVGFFAVPLRAEA
jgi:hypothetical protein